MSGRTVRRRGRLALLAVGLACGLAACGVPVGGHPATIARQDVPFGLLDRSAPTTPTTTSAPLTALSTVQIYLVGPTSHVVAEDRDIPTPSSGLDSDTGLTTILQALVAGPTPSEAAAGDEGEIPTGTRVLSGTQISGGIATVNLSASFGQLAGQTQIEAIAQVVFTVIGALPDVTGVTFEIAGQQAAVPSPPTGALVNVATRALYDSLGPL